MNIIPSTTVRRAVMAVFLLLPAALTAQPITYVEPYGGNFTADGTVDNPNNNFYGVVNSGRGFAYEFRGDMPVYGSVRIASPARLTRNSGSGPFRIGAPAVAETTFRCIAYNVRLGEPNPFSTGWASPQRAAFIRNYDWGAWDAFGFCEVWDIADSYNNHIRLMGFGDHRTVTGLDFGGSPQHGGLVLHSRHDLSNTSRGVYQDCAHALEDCLANKGWVRGRMVKNGIGIWVYMTHTQADASVTGFGATSWTTIYSARKKQLEQLRADVNAMQASNPDDVFFLMGDFNVMGEDKSPPGSPDQKEYSTVLADVLGPQILGGMDAARHFWPRNLNHTFSQTNTLMKHYYPTLGEGESGRLDYIIAVNSLSRKVVIETTNYQVLYPQSGGFTADGFTSTELSDHWPVRGDFRIFRRSN
jgi:hypothetical protein